MVTLSQNPYWRTPQAMTPADWLARLPTINQHSALLEHAAQLAYVSGHEVLGIDGISYWQQGLSIAEFLIEWHADHELLAAALLYPIWNHADLNLADVEETTSKNIARLLAGAAKMDAVSDLHHAKHKSPQQIENCRKMLLAMVDDVRIVLLKLAERLHALHTAPLLDSAAQKQLGTEILSTYAPLANRLGLGQLKWQLEDLAFRITQPKEYKTIAKQLDMKRTEREALIQKTITMLRDYLTAASIKNFELMGRAKHIYSIHKKMMRKNLNLAQLFDISAVRILVDSIEDCYRVLDVVQQHFEMISSEFDDYISAPKENGYQSIHTAVYGPDKHIIEIQIRTHLMHQESELGVSAHWRYKEGSLRNQDYETKIAWLREVLSWQNEIEARARPEQNILADRVYVLTPAGDIMDLPQGATPLDFAYTIHTSLGHRCRGAKINDHIVTLNTPLKMGDCVSILTSKIQKPSRDWLSIPLGFLATARARAKVAHWFREKDRDRQISSGKTTLDQTLKRLSIHDIEHEALAHKFHYDSKEALYAAIGHNTLRTTQLSNRLEHWYKSAPEKLPAVLAHPPTSAAETTNSTGILVEGTAYWLTHIARCCQPLPGDAIAGYISQKHSIAIHKVTCSSFLTRQNQKPERVLSAHWGHKAQEIPVTLLITSTEGADVSNQVIHAITQQKLALLGIKKNMIDHHKNHAIEVYTRVLNLDTLNKLIALIQKIPQVQMVYRK